MTEMNDDQLRQAFFDLFAIKSNETAVRKWGQNMVRSLERRIEEMESHLQERNETIDELEREIKIYQAAVSKITGSTSQESDEDRHQRHRRERLLDEVTLICVRDGIERMRVGETENTMWGRNSRDIAENICHGINEHDANN